MRHLFVFRHGETDWNAEERFQGQIDVALNERGREQARVLAPALGAQRIEVLLSSDLSRARETAEIVARELALSLHLDAGLREAHLGEAQGLTRAEIEARFGVEAVRRWRSWQISDADVFYPGGETGISIAARAFQALEGFLARHPFERIGVATHGGVIRRLMQKILPPGSDPVPIPNGVLYHVTRADSGEWKFERRLD